ncbi:MAG: discoidin domain-containing protein [Nitrospirota bacterium]
MILHRILFILIFLLGIALRVIYLITPDLDSDQAIMGLMARHILDGEFPVFFWGESYEGPIESYFASIIFALFGSSQLTLSLSPFIFSLVFIFLIYLLTKDMFNEKVALIAMFFVSASPSFLIGFSVIPNGNYIQNLMFGTLLLLMTSRFVNLNCHSDPESSSGQALSGKTRFFALLRMTSERFRVKTPKDVARYYIVIGFTAGLAWWANFQIIHFLLTAFTLMFLKDKWRFIKRGIIYLFPSFMIGSSPFWYFNLTHNWASFFEMQRYTEKVDLFDSLSVFFDLKLPWALGPFFHVQDMWNLNKYFLLIYGASLLYFILSYKKGILNIFRLSTKRMNGSEIPLVFLIIFSIIMINWYNWGNPGRTLRYYLPIYSVFPIILAASIYNAGKSFRPLPILLIIFLASSNIYGIIKGSIFFDSERLKGYRESREVEKNYFDFLSSKGIKYVAEISYWRSFKYTFYASEKVIFALPTIDWHPNKYPAYTEGLQSHSNPAFMWRRGGRNFENVLKAQGITYTKDVLYDYFYTFHSLKMTERKGGPIPAYDMTATSNYNEIAPGSAIDRNIISAWSPKTSRDERMYFEVDMKKPYLINKVSILNGGSFDENPEGFELDVSLDRKKWSRVISLPVLFGGFILRDGIPVLDGGHLISVFDPVKARYIRMRQGEGKSSMNWHIAEIFIYGPSETVIDEEKNPAYLLGLKYFKEKRWEEALIEFLRVIEVNPDSESSHYHLWLISKKLRINTGDYLYHLGFDSSVLLNRLAGIYEKKGDIKNADFFREKIIERFSPSEKRSVNFDGKIEFLGFDIKHSRAPEIVYYWKATGKIKKDWTAFVHFISPDGKIAFQNDHLLSSGGKPSSKWIKNESYKESFSIDVPKGIHSGTYQIKIGIWDPKTGKRLKVKSDFQKKMDSITVGELNVTG